MRNLPLRRPTRPVLIALTVAVGLAGCASNPFLDHYVGQRQSPTKAPERLLKEQELPRLGATKFDVDMRVGKVPGDDQALAAAKAVGAESYWWTSRPKYNAGNTTAGHMERSGRVGQTSSSGIGWGEKALKWYEYEAVFYARRPRSDQ